MHCGGMRSASHTLSFPMKKVLPLHLDSSGFTARITVFRWRLLATCRAISWSVSEAKEAGSYVLYNKRTICFYVSVSKLARTPVDMYEVNDRMGSDYREIGVDTKFIPPEEPLGK